jgi:hypothetical protein
MTTTPDTEENIVITLLTQQLVTVFFGTEHGISMTTGAVGTPLPSVGLPICGVRINTGTPSFVNQNKLRFLPALMAIAKMFAVTMLLTVVHLPLPPNPATSLVLTASRQAARR